jgi:lipopolysaccharide transport system ATP-binding protein
LRLKSLEWLCDLPLKNGEKLKARILFETHASIANVAVGFGFSDLSGNRILTYDTDLQNGYRPSFPQPGLYAVDVEIARLPLQPFAYAVDIGCRSGDSYTLDYIPSALQLEVFPGPATPTFIAHRLAGVRLESNWVWNLHKSVTSPPKRQKIVSIK